MAEENMDDSMDEDSVFDNIGRRRIEMVIQIANDLLAEADRTQDGSDDDDELDEPQEPTVKFDQSLPSSHSYLGEEMDDVLGRTVLEDGNIVSMPLLDFPRLLLVPGQTLPLNLYQPRLVTMIRNLLEKDKTFGVITCMPQFSRGLPSDDEVKQVTGTTCEIYSAKEDSEDGIISIKVKAMARKRFQVLSIRRQVDGVRIGTVRILPDVLVPAYPRNALAECVKARLMVTSPAGADRKVVMRTPQKMAPSCSAWPSWVYELYNPYLLIAKIKAELRSWSSNLNTNMLPSDVTAFSYWVTHNVPMDDKLRHSLLRMNCPIERLRKQLEIMQKYSVMVCQDCHRFIADKKDLFSMSYGGLMGSYVNPSGAVHETVTFHKAKGLLLRGSASTEHSWFPGYAWTIAECKSCRVHMGWKFTAVNKNLVPRKFWGLTRASLRPSFRQEGDA